MSENKILNVDDAYALETPEDSVRLYGEWAPDYDSGFVERVGYVLFRRVAEQFARHADRVHGAVLDVGCGTGSVGACLRESGIETIDGIDISPEMLVEAGKKKTTNGDPVYRNLIQADLTTTLDIADDQYAGLVSAGTFTHGHLGPGPLDELWRVAVPGAQCAIGVRSTHYESAGFARKLAAAVAAGTITEPKLVEVDLYTAETPNREHANDKALVVVCQIAK
ncbi:MAG: class I SAM-dependent methyltransferase [Gammaproteobacteria bacterium]|nr:class I SAM-dependent methyltransferase [Gammaproteobacteria bacterium]